jgi:hypothetical protein
VSSAGVNSAAIICWEPLPSLVHRPRSHVLARRKWSGGFKYVKMLCVVVTALTIVDRRPYPLPLGSSGSTWTTLLTYRTQHCFGSACGCCCSRGCLCLLLALEGPWPATLTLNTVHGLPSNVHHTPVLRNCSAAE